MKCFLAILLFLLAGSQSLAQPLKTEKLKVFIDCSNVWCDYNYMRGEITLVDFFNDREAADVHVLITTVQNGNGGSNYQLIFFGQNRYKDDPLILTFNTIANATSTEIREALTTRIKLGLISFLARTPFASQVKIEMKLQADSINPTTQINNTDKWNYWVMRVGLDGSLNADQVYKNYQANGYISANRTTDKIRLNMSVYYGYNRSDYNYEDNGTPVTFSVLNTDYQIEHTLIKSLGNHWGLGYQTSLSNNTFSNNKQRLYFKTAVEYSLFPYKDVNTRLLTFSYGLHVRSNAYYDTTIYLKTNEFLIGQSLQARLNLNKKWGSMSSWLSYNNYLHDASLNNLYMRLQMDVRITGGLSFTMYTSGGLVRDQVFLVKGKASEQDILSRRRQIASDYYIYSGIGINYRFGSKLNNFVNPRLEGL